MKKPILLSTLVSVTMLAAVAAPAQKLPIERTVLIIGSSPAGQPLFSQTIYRADLSLANPVPLYTLPTSEEAMNTGLSPDGRTIVVASRDGYTGTIHFRRLAGSNGRLQAHTTVISDSPSVGFTPDCKYALLNQSSESGCDVFILAIAGGSLRRLTFDGNVANYAPSLITAGGILYYLDNEGTIHSEHAVTHKRKRTYPVATDIFTISASGDTLVYETYNDATGLPEIDTIDTTNGQFNQYILDDPLALLSDSLAISQDERFVYFANVQHDGPRDLKYAAERLNLNNGRFSYPTTGISVLKDFTTTGVPAD